MRKKIWLKTNQDYLRNFIFGSEDSLVSTAGFMFGVSTSNIYDTQQLVLAGAVLIAVEAMSMAAGSFLTETNVHEMDKSHKDLPIIDGIIMFLSYFAAGTLILLPYILLPISSARYVSIIFSLSSLFVLGILPFKRLRDGFRMLVVAGLAILIGFGAAQVFDTNIN